MGLIVEGGSPKIKYTTCCSCSERYGYTKNDEKVICEYITSTNCPHCQTENWKKSPMSMIWAILTFILSLGLLITFLTINLNN